jgi:hypothetical protein
MDQFRVAAHFDAEVFPAVGWRRRNTNRVVDVLYVELAEQLRAPLND